MSFPEVKFRIVRGRSWNGNGFGTDPAWWDAELDGEVIATWRPNSSRPGGDIYGKRTFAIYKQREWRAAVLKEVERRCANEK